MDDLSSFQNFLDAQTVHLSTLLLVVDFVLAALLAWLLRRVYMRCGGGFSNRERFSRNFIVLAMTTMLIITVVRSSLALSVGLAGALSIIRFRAAIKEPEELTYVLLCVALGVGLGAERTLITVCGLSAIMLILVVRHWRGGRESHSNFHLTVLSPGSNRLTLAGLLETVKAHAASAALQRFDESADVVEAAFSVQFADTARLDACARQLRALGEGVRISYVEQSGLGV